MNLHYVKRAPWWHVGSAMKGLKTMASTEDDSDLLALRLAALASCKTRPQISSDEITKPPRPDAELENLRSAALHSKRDQNDQFQTSRNLSKRCFMPSRGYRRDFAHPRGHPYNRGANLIVIQPVPLEENSQQATPTSAFLMRPQDRYCSVLNEDDASQSPRQQKAKYTGKFSRFESDSSGDDSSESEFSESEEAKSPESSEESEKKSEEESLNGENTNDDNEDSDDILFLHPEEQLQEGEQLLDDKDGDESFINEQTEHTGEEKIEEKSNLNVTERNGKGPSSSNRTRDDDGCVATNGLSQKLKSRVGRSKVESHESSRNKDVKERRNRHTSKDRSKIRMQRDKDSRPVHRGGDEEKTEKRAPRIARTRDHENDERRRRKQRDRRELDKKSEKIKSDVREKHNRRGEEKQVDVKADKITSESAINNRKIRPASDLEEPKVRHARIPREGQQNTRPAHRESSSVAKLQSPPSSKSQSSLPSDLRQKLKSRSSKNDVAFDVGEHKRQEHSQRDSAESSSEEKSSGRVKSVLSVVKVSSSEPKIKKSSRTVKSKMESPQSLKTVEKVSKKIHSPVLCDGSQSPSMRKVLLLKEGKSFSDDDNRGSKRTRINITLTEASLENEEVSSKERVPVRLRLGNIPKSSKQTSKPDPVQISHHHHHHHSDRGYRSSSPSFVSKSTSKKRASPGDADTSDPPRKVKLKRDAFLSSVKLTSSTKINGFPSIKSHNESGKTYENELDEKIRRIRAKNQAIMKRKCEIAEDEQVNY